MNIKKLLLATLASFIVMFALGGLWHMAIIHDWMIQHAGLAGDISRKEPMLHFIALGALLLSFLMSYIYPKGVESDNKVMEGLKFGVVMGILWILPFSLILYGATTMFSIKVVMVDAAWHIVEQGIGGIVIAWVYGNDVNKK